MLSPIIIMCALQLVSWMTESPLECVPVNAGLITM